MKQIATNKLLVYIMDYIMNVKGKSIDFTVTKPQITFQSAANSNYVK